MRILLTAPPLIELLPEGKKAPMRSCPNLALYLLASLMEREGHNIRVIDPLNFESAFGSLELVRNTLAGIELLGISVNSCTWPRALKLIQNLKNLPHQPLVVLGGPHVNLLDQYLLRNFPLDYIVREEAEKSFPALLRALEKDQDPAQVPGISFCRRGEVIRNPLGAQLSSEELAEQPLPKFELMPADYYEVIPIESSRGCLSSCIFCSSPFKRKWRGISPKQVVERISQHIPFLERATKKVFFLVDDCFTADPERFKAISQELSGFKHPLVFEARVSDLVKPEMLKALSQLPIQLVEMGIESGYPEGLNKVRKKISLEQVKKVAEFLREKEFRERARFSFIIGFPWETRKEVLSTLEFAFKLSARVQSRLIINWLTIFPGSPLFKNRYQWGIELLPSAYDQEEWWAQEQFFKSTHPKLNPEEDLDAVYSYIKLLKELFPGVKPEGILRWV